MDRAEFDKLVIDHLPAMQRLAVRLTGNPHDAEDLMQDAILKTIRHWRTFEGRSTFSTWMTRIVINAFRDRLHKKQRQPDLRLMPQRTGQATPADHIEAEDLKVHVAQLISTLPPRQREVLVLMSYERHAPAAAAEILGMTEQNVRTTLHHARQKLRELLQPIMREQRP